jgi:hypoxanthine phosphoribosyltransferase
MAKSVIRKIIDDSKVTRKTLKRIDELLNELEEQEILTARQAAGVRRAIEEEKDAAYEAIAERKRAEALRIKRSYHGRSIPKKKK